MKNNDVFNRVMIVVFAVIAFVFTASYAFSQYLEVKKINIQDLAVWNACVEDSNLGEQAYQFCRQKCSDNYMFKKPFNWGPGAGVSDGDE